MSVTRPFRAVRYNTARERDLSKRLSPPYDILDNDAKRILLDRDPRNFVAIDLPHTPPKAAGPADAYARASTTLQAWLSDATMVRDADTAIYVYQQRYEHGGRAYVRKMFFAGLQLEAFGSGSVFPHERTFGGPKEDRLCLTKATAANLSPIFGLYQDADNAVARRLEAELSSEPLAIGTLDGVENLLWAVSDADAIRDVTALMEPRPAYIADGHHRYGTALMYRDWLSAERGPLPDDHPANFVLCVFCAMEDAGLLILPTHRVVKGVSLSAGLFQADDNVKVTSLDGSDPTQALAALARLGPQAVALYNPAETGYFALQPAARNLLDPLEPDRSRAWRALGLAFLHAYLLDRVVTPKVTGGAAPQIAYVKSDAEAVAAAQQSGGSAFLMQATTMEELRAVCQAGDLMPQKSTYFYPKLASGLVIRPLVG